MQQIGLVVNLFIPITVLPLQQAVLTPVLSQEYHLIPQAIRLNLRFLSTKIKFFAQYLGARNHT